MGKRPRSKIERHLPAVGTILVAHYKGKQYTTKIVESPDFSGKKAVDFDDVLYKSMTGAAIAVTGCSTNWGAPIFSTTYNDRLPAFSSGCLTSVTWLFS